MNVLKSKTPHSLSKDQTALPATHALRTVRLAARAFALAGVMFVAGGCDRGSEGDRCNPLLSHNECSDGLTCQQPATCAENYCCPAQASSSTNPYCNGSACPPADAGGGSVSDAGAGQDAGK